MPTYKFSLSAEDDIDGIIDYTVEKWGANQALKYLDGLEKQAQFLAETPTIGKNRDSLAQGLKSFPYESHVLYFIEVEPNSIIIARVLHETMDPVLHFDHKDKERDC